MLFCFSMSWALLTMLPLHLFRTNPTFRGMNDIGTERAWTFPLHVVAIAYICGYFTGRPAIRMIAALIGSILFMFIAVLLFLVSPKWYGLPCNTGVWIYGWTGLFSFEVMCTMSRFVIVDVWIWLARLKASVRADARLIVPDLKSRLLKLRGWICGKS
jgi:hypothetical protein